VNAFFSIYLILPAALGPLKISTRTEEKVFLRSAGRPERKADNLAAMCEPIV
jgi:hypothetical protein